MSHKISIIVPVYNVQKYLDKCIQSIINQTYKNIEIILVNDGSTDNSGIICEKYADIDSRIIYINKQNGGLSSARNSGLDVCCGDYIGFVDSDDYIDPSMYEKMFSFMINEDCDIVECGVNYCTDTEVEYFRIQDNEVVSGKEALKRHLDITSKLLLPRTAVWSKLYKRRFWSENRFPLGHVHEDYLLTCKDLYIAEKVGLLKEGLYFHLTTNKDSIVNTKFSERDLYKERQMAYRIDFLNENRELELLEYAKAAYYNNLITTIWKCDENDMPQKNHYINIIRRELNNILNSLLPIEKKIEIILIAIFPSCYLVLRHYYNKFKGIRK